jgi:hypothetical protein
MLPRRPLLFSPLQHAMVVCELQLPMLPGAFPMAGMAETATALAMMVKMVENCMLIDLIVW